MVKGLQTNWGTCSRTVSLDGASEAIACSKDLITVGMQSGKIIILDAFTGIQISILSEHTSCVRSLVFSSDGTFLVSGGDDMTVNFWDIQTGGVIKTFHGHTKSILSVSISADYAKIASGSKDKTIRLWDASTGKCYCVIDGHNNNVHSVSFSPTNPQLLMSASQDHTVKQWDINGYQLGPTYSGDHAAFSPDGTHFVVCGETVAVIQSSNSGVVASKILLPLGGFQYCCFFPNSKFVAGIAGNTVYVWDITSPKCSLAKTFIEHTKSITSLIFSSSLISFSKSGSIKFWQIGTSLADLVRTDSESTQFVSASIGSISLQANDGIFTTSDLGGVVRTWDISTGLCKEFFQTECSNHWWRDTWRIDDRLICVWIDSGYTWVGFLEHDILNIWDTKRGLLQPVKIPKQHRLISFRISGDGSMVLFMDITGICARSIWTGEVVGEVRFESRLGKNPLIVDGSRVWVYFEDSQAQGWDFGTTGSTPIPLSHMSLCTPHLDLVDEDTGPSKIKDTVTRKEVYRLSGRYTHPHVIQWDGQYLVAGYDFGEILVLDFSHMIPQ